MADITYEQVLAGALQLPPDQQEQLIEDLQREAYRPKPLKSLTQIVTEQGVKPVDYDQLLKSGEFFPAEESVDDLVNLIHELRREDAKVVA